MERGRRELKRPLWSRLAVPVLAAAVVIVLVAARPGRRAEIRAGTPAPQETQDPPSVPEILLSDGDMPDGTISDEADGAASDGAASDGSVPSDGDASLTGSDSAQEGPSDDGAVSDPGEDTPVPKEDPVPVQEDAPPAPIGYDDASSLPMRLRLSTTDFTVRELGQDTRLRVSGGSGTYTWISEDPSIARVGPDGTVTSVSSGTTHVAVTDGSSSAVCIVRVRAAAGQSAPSGQYQLNRTDFTIHVGDDPFRLQLSGGDAPGLTWDSSDTSVAKVDQNGIVVPVGPGTATVTASWEGRSLTCIVRVPQD